MKEVKGKRKKQRKQRVGVKTQKYNCKIFKKQLFVLIALKATLPTSNARSETSASRSTRI
jgi:hypothetical protein